MIYAALCRRAADILGDWPNTADGWQFEDAALFRALAEVLDRKGKVWDADLSAFTIEDVRMLLQWEKDVLASDGMFKQEGAKEIRSLANRIALSIEPSLNDIR